MCAPAAALGYTGAARRLHFPWPGHQDRMKKCRCLRWRSCRSAPAYPRSRPRRTAKVIVTFRLVWARSVTAGSSGCRARVRHRAQEERCPSRPGPQRTTRPSPFGTSITSGGARITPVLRCDAEGAGFRSGGGPSGAPAAADHRENRAAPGTLSRRARARHLPPAARSIDRPAHARPRAVRRPSRAPSSRPD